MLSVPMFIPRVARQQKIAGGCSGAPMFSDFLPYQLNRSLPALPAHLGRDIHHDSHSCQLEALDRHLDDGAVLLAETGGSDRFPDACLWREHTLFREAIA